MWWQELSSFVCHINCQNNCNKETKKDKTFDDDKDNYDNDIEKIMITIVNMKLVSVDAKYLSRYGNNDNVQLIEIVCFFVLLKLCLEQQWGWRQ